MKSVARMELTPGMILGEDVIYQNNVLYARETVLTDAIIERLKRYSIMCVTVMEDKDYAKTHYERIRYQEDFKQFEKKHTKNLFLYKKLLSTFLSTGQLVSNELLLAIYNDIESTYSSGSELLDFLYNLMPNEDELTYNHSLNSALLGGTFAKWVNLSPEETQKLILCCFYYDIGKLRIPYNLLWKPGKLTPEEYEYIKIHTLIGYHSLNITNIDKDITEAVLTHHERMDGSGYPNNLMGKDISIYARYIAIIDTYIAMASPRSYRSAITPLQIMEHFEKNLEKYDTELLLPLMKRISDAQIGTSVQLTDDSIWEVFIIHPTKIARPILKNEDGQILDLNTRPDLSIVKLV